MILKKIIAKAIKIIFEKEPLRVVFARYFLKKTGFGSYFTRLSLEIVPRPYYGFPIYQSLKLAQSLGYKKVSIIEFGVASGDGLLNIEYHVKEIKKKIDIDVEIYGFDLASGLPETKDYRDLLYQWKTGFYKMDVQKLKSKLSSAKLVLGDIKKSLEKFTHAAPVACVIIDVDYYTSTIDALEVFKLPHLPRVFCYFDDVVGNETSLYNEFTGELLAIDEFNQKNTMKIAKYRSDNTSYKEHMFIMHDFEHAEYNKYVNTKDDGAGYVI